MIWCEFQMKRWRKRVRDHVSPLGSLEAAAMKLSAAVCNLLSYTVSDRWRRIFGSKHLGELDALGHNFWNVPFLDLNSFTVCWSRCFIYPYSGFGQTPPLREKSLPLGSPSAWCRSLHLDRDTHHSIALVEINDIESMSHTHSPSLYHCLVGVKYAVQLPEAFVHVSDVGVCQNVTPAQPKTLLDVDEAVIAAQRGANQQTNTCQPHNSPAHFQ